MTTPEQLAHDAGVAMGNALVDALETPILKLAEKIAETRAEQAELRDEVHALANRIEAVTRRAADEDRAGGRNTLTRFADPDEAS